MATLTPAYENNEESNFLFMVFCAWTLVLICRPQDFLLFLQPLRPALALGVLCLLTFLFTGRSTKNGLFDNKQVRLYVALLSVMVFSILFSYYARLSFNFVFIIYSQIVLFFVFFIITISDIKRLERVLFACCVGIGLYSLIYLVKGATVVNRVTFGEMFDPNDIAFVVLSIIMFNFVFLRGKSSTSMKVVSVANICAGFLLILKTGSRGGFVAALVASALLLFSKKRVISMKYKGLFLLALIVYLLSSNNDFTRFETILHPKEDYNMTDEQGRVAIWKMGMRAMLLRPVSGVGVGCFPEAVGRDREKRGLGAQRWQTAHNSFVQFGTETGVIGLVIFILLNLGTFRIFRRIRSVAVNEKLANIAEMAFIGFSGVMVSAMFLSQAYSVYLVLYFALSVVLSRFLEEEAASVSGLVSPAQFSTSLPTGLVPHPAAGGVQRVDGGEFLPPFRGRGQARRAGEG
jgi:hypothetical protein